MSDEIPIDHLRTWIGKQDRQTDIITPELLKRFNATLGGYANFNTELPLGIHWCLAQPSVARDSLGEDGHPAKGGFMPPVPLPRRMWASSKIQFNEAPSIGVSVEKISTIADVVLKQSAASGSLVFVHVDNEYVQDNKSLIEDRQIIVYRTPSAFKQTDPKDPQNSNYSFSIVPDSTLLFRYSAMTFNGHRIHYDQNYVTDVEGYPGLVVHGPLTATLLMNIAQASQPNKTLRKFEFRGTAPAFVDQTLELLVKDDAAKSLEARNHHGALIMSASAEYSD